MSTNLYTPPPPALLEPVCLIPLTVSIFISLLKTEAKWEKTHMEDVSDLDLATARSKLRLDTTPVIYICATMWHETDNEMIQMLKSLFR